MLSDLVAVIVATVPGMLSRINLLSPQAESQSSPLQQLVSSPSFDRKVTAS